MSMIEGLTQDVDGFIFDERLAIYRPDELQIANAMTDAVTKHAGNEIDGFSALEHSPSDYAFQRADCIAASGKAATTEGMRKLAPIFFKPFESVVHQVVEEKRPMLSAIAGAFENGHDVTIANDHRQIIGVAIISCIIAASLYESDEIKYGEFNTEISVSAMLKYTKVHGLPAFPLLQNVFSMTRSVIPAVNEENKAKLPKDYAKDNNQLTLQARQSYTAKPKLSAVAPGATGDAYTPRKIRRLGNRANIEKGYYMAPPTDGTADEFMVNKYVLATGLDLSKDSNGIFIGRLHRPSQIPTRAEAYAVISEMAEGISAATGVKSFFIPDMNKFREIKRVLQSRKNSIANIER